MHKMADKLYSRLQQVRVCVCLCVCGVCVCVCGVCVCAGGSWNPLDASAGTLLKTAAGRPRQLVLFGRGCH